jgi:hypothetical protein
MHSTGIEPVSTPWKGAILPLNYKCFDMGSPHSYRRLFLGDLNAVGTMCLGRSRHHVPWTQSGISHFTHSWALRALWRASSSTSATRTARSGTSTTSYTAFTIRDTFPCYLLIHGNITHLRGFRSRVGTQARNIEIIGIT